jgi:hypothetical protein
MNYENTQWQIPPFLLDTMGGTHLGALLRKNSPQALHGEWLYAYNEFDSATFFERNNKQYIETTNNLGTYLLEYECDGRLNTLSFFLYKNIAHMLHNPYVNVSEYIRQHAEKRAAKEALETYILVHPSTPSLIIRTGKNPPALYPLKEENGIFTQKIGNNVVPIDVYATVSEETVSFQAVIESDIDAVIGFSRIAPSLSHTLANPTHTNAFKTLQEVFVLR